VRAAGAPALRWRRYAARHPLSSLVVRRVAAGIVTLFVVAIVIFLATQVLPGNAAYAILGRDATPTRLHALEHQLHLDQSVVRQFGSWFGGVLSGHLGVSLANGASVWSQVGTRLANSAVLVALAGVIGSLLGIVLGAIAALRRGSLVDRALSIAALAVTALPEFVVGIVLIILLATNVSHLLPAVSQLAPGTYVWSQPKDLVLPVLTLVIVIVPYTMRMMRATTIEALESDYVELATLKGMSAWRVVLIHALPNAIAPTVQVIGLNFLYLAGGIVVVEYVFGFPGIGQGLVNAVADRDVPVIQFTVLILAAFYTVMNITTDVISLLATPRRRLAR
jgi:peptide/nickel transport system permease protein